MYPEDFGFLGLYCQCWAVEKVADVNFGCVERSFWAGSPTGSRGSLVSAVISRSVEEAVTDASSWIGLGGMDEDIIASIMIFSIFGARSSAIFERILGACLARIGDEGSGSAVASDIVGTKSPPTDGGENIGTAAARLAGFFGKEPGGNHSRLESNTYFLRYSLSSVWPSLLWLV